MECLHRFCRECIDKSMQLGNNECLLAAHTILVITLCDPNYDSLIVALYPNIDEYEKEEKDCNKQLAGISFWFQFCRLLCEQIQANIDQTMRRKSEALGRRNSRNAVDNQGSDDNEDANGNDGGKDSSSTDEQTEPRPKRRRWGSAWYYLPSSAGAGADRGGDENDSKLNRETMGASVGLISSSERLAWGKGGMRSHTRHGSNNGDNGKNLNIQLMLVSSNEETIPSLQQPYLCCEPTCQLKTYLDFHRHVKILSMQYVALQTALLADEIELYLVKELDDQFNLSTSTKVPVFKSGVLESKEKLQVLREEETLVELNTHSSANGYLVLTYQKKWSSI
ncbi:hypothetical protein UlMin_012446 [Ulmus minor]